MYLPELAFCYCAPFIAPADKQTTFFKLYVIKNCNCQEFVISILAGISASFVSRHFVAIFITCAPVEAK